ncbi:hypothetical protein Trydic_g14591 [Trypoxylus dichotomus]
MNTKMGFSRCLLGVTVVLMFLQLCTHVQEVKTAELVRHYCGKALMQTLSLVCQSRYNRPNDKRYLGDTYDKPFMLEADYKKPPSSLNDLFLGESFDIYDSDLPRYRITKGVVDDCCYSPCSFRSYRGKETRKKAKRVLFHQDSAPVRKSGIVETKLPKLKFQTLEHSPYSPDSAPSYYHFFLKLKRHLGGMRFVSDEKLIAAKDHYFAELEEMGTVKDTGWKAATCRLFGQLKMGGTPAVSVYKHETAPQSCLHSATRHSSAEP